MPFLKSSTASCLLFVLAWSGCNKSGSEAGGVASSTPQTAETVLAKVQDNCKAELGKFDNYALQLEDMGTVYTQKLVAAGSNTAKLEVRIARKEGDKETPVGDQNIYEMWDRARCAALESGKLKEIAGRAKFVGSEKVDNADAYVLQIEPKDLSALGNLVFEGMPKSAQIKDTKAYVDAQKGFIRKIQSSVTEQVRNQSQTATVSFIWSDFRDVKGLSIPHQSQMVTEGKGVGMTDEEKNKAKEQIKADMQRLSQLPAEQQEMAKQFLAQQEKQLDQISADRVSQSMKLSGAKVNEGVPQGIF